MGEWTHGELIADRTLQHITASRSEFIAAHGGGSSLKVQSHIADEIARRNRRPRTIDEIIASFGVQPEMPEGD
jgi:hypothetical protein